MRMFSDLSFLVWVYAVATALLQARGVLILWFESWSLSISWAACFLASLRLFFPLSSQLPQAAWGTGTAASCPCSRQEWVGEKGLCAFQKHWQATQLLALHRTVPWLPFKSLRQGHGVTWLIPTSPSCNPTCSTQYLCLIPSTLIQRSYTTHPVSGSPGAGGCLQGEKPCAGRRGGLLAGLGAGGSLPRSWDAAGSRRGCGAG